MQRPSDSGPYRAEIFALRFCTFLRLFLLINSRSPLEDKIAKIG
jgi:hypothetical protein